MRRPTGGLAVLHHHELTYAAAVPVGVLGSPRETYRALSAALAAGLRRLGVAAEVVAPGPVGPGSPGGYLATSAVEARCFGAAAPGEVAVASRKLVGSAQRREGRTLLQHGSILLDGAQDAVLELFGDGAAAVVGGLPRPATLRELLADVPPVERLIGSLVAGAETLIGIRLAGAGLSPGDRERLQPLVERFRSSEWTWRR